MAVDTLRPNEDVVNAWTKSSGTTSFGALDDAVTAPTNARTSGDGVHITSSTAGQESEVGFGTFTLGTDVVSQVRLKVFAAGGNRRGAAIRLLTGTTELATGSLVAASPATAEAWITVTYTGTLTQSQIDALRCELVCTSIAGGSATAATIYAAYIEVDHAAVVVYTDTPSGGPVVTGSRVEEARYTDERSGTAQAAGQAADAAVRADSPAGGVVITGAAVDGAGRETSPTGAAAVTGSAVDEYGKSYEDAPAGAAAVTGSLDEEHGRAYTDSPSGTATVTGSVTESWSTGTTYEDAPSGTVTSTGPLEDSLTRTSTAAGTVEFIGWAETEAVYSDAPAGTVVVTGRLAAAQFAGAETGQIARPTTGRGAGGTGGRTIAGQGRIESSRTGRPL